MDDTTCCNCGWVGDSDDTIIVEDDRGIVCPLCGSAELADYDPRDEAGHETDDSGEGKIFGRERIGESRAYESSMSEYESYLDSEPIDVDE